MLDPVLNQSLLYSVLAPVCSLLVYKPSFWALVFWLRTLGPVRGIRLTEYGLMLDTLHPDKPTLVAWAQQLWGVSQSSKALPNCDPADVYTGKFRTANSLTRTSTWTVVVGSYEHNLLGLKWMLVMHSVYHATSEGIQGVAQRTKYWRTGSVSQRAKSSTFRKSRRSDILALLTAKHLSITQPSIIASESIANFESRAIFRILTSDCRPWVIVGRGRYKWL